MAWEGDPEAVPIWWTREEPAHTWTVALLSPHRPGETSKPSKTSGWYKRTLLDPTESQSSRATCVPSPKCWRFPKPVDSCSDETGSDFSFPKNSSPPVWSSREIPLCAATLSCCLCFLRLVMIVSFSVIESGCWNSPRTALLTVFLGNIRNQLVNTLIQIERGKILSPRRSIPGIEFRSNPPRPNLETGDKLQRRQLPTYSVYARSTGPTLWNSQAHSHRVSQYQMTLTKILLGSTKVLSQPNYCTTLQSRDWFHTIPRSTIYLCPFTPQKIQRHLWENLQDSAKLHSHLPSSPKSPHQCPALVRTQTF